MTPTLPPVPRPPENDHWAFLRDVVVFQVKMLLDNARDFALMPVSLAAALVDLFYRGEQGRGTFFYQVLRWGAESERMIDVYSAIERKQAGGELPADPGYTVDSLVARMERVIVRECEKGGTAAAVKTAMDRAFARVHVEGAGRRDLIARAGEKLRAQPETPEASGPESTR